MSTIPTINPLRELEDYVLGSTIVYRKGDVVSHQHLSNLDVVTVDNFPALPDGLRSVVDCHFVYVGFTEGLAVRSHRQFYDKILEAEHGAYAEMTKETWAQGPSYITIGAWIGDQTTAFRFMACVQAHGLAKVIIPATLGITDETAANNMAGGGFVMLSGLKEPSDG